MCCGKREQEKQPPPKGAPPPSLTNVHISFQFGSENLHAYLAGGKAKGHAAEPDGKSFRYAGSVRFPEVSLASPIYL